MYVNSCLVTPVIATTDSLVYCAISSMPLAGAPLEVAKVTALQSIATSLGKIASAISGVSSVNARAAAAVRIAMHRCESMQRMLLDLTLCAVCLCALQLLAGASGQGDTSSDDSDDDEKQGGPSKKPASSVAAGAARKTSSEGTAAASAAAAAGTKDAAPDPTPKALHSRQRYAPLWIGVDRCAAVWIDLGRC
jgi:hypothetical protein